MTTIKEIANQAGVSIATVSRVLNGQAGVSEIKRRKILQVAEDLNYNMQRFPGYNKESFPRIMVLMLIPDIQAETEALLIDGMESARKNYGYKDSDVSVYTTDDTEEALGQLQHMQEYSVDLDAVIIFGNIPDPFRKSLLSLRGRGCPMLFIESESPDFSPLTTISYERQMFYELSYRLAEMLDKKRQGIFIHQTGKNLSGQGSFDPENKFKPYDSIRNLYPEGNFHVQNKGAFAGDLFPDVSLIMLDSEKASEQAISYTSGLETRPLIITCGSGDTILSALQANQIDATLTFHVREMGYRAVQSLAQRLIYKQQIPTEIKIFPHLYFPCQHSKLRYEVKNPIPFQCPGTVF